MKTLKLLSIFLAAFLIACSSDDGAVTPMNDDDGVIVQQDGQDASSANSILSFSISAGDNNLPVDADVQIDGNNYSVFYPSNTDLSSIVTTFTLSPEAILFVDGQEITSGQTPIDFTETTTLTVEAEDGSQNSYQVSSTSNFGALDTAVQDLMSTYAAPGFQIALVKDERLVYTNTFGNADLAGTEPVTNDSRYRIASVSKPITVIAILKLVQDGALELDDTVFGTDGILGFDYGDAPYGTNVENITVRHLIDHTSGWVNNPNDPMFTNITWSHQQLIDDIVNNRPLETTPGTTYHYSNFGYCLLGRVVEKASGLSYGEYVKQAVLAPAGINSMEIGNSSIDDKWPNEVEYFSQEAFDPYGQMNTPRLDSAGGWVATATDLARLLVTVDGGSGVADLISANILDNSYIGGDNWWFAGSLPGTSAVVGKLNQDYHYVILTNTRTLPDIFAIITDMQSVMQAEIQTRTQWPNFDLF